MVVVPALHNADRHLQLPGRVQHEFPEALFPIRVAAVGVGDPVPVPGQLAAPKGLVHLHMGAVAAGLQIVRLYLPPGVAHGPGGEDVVPEQPALIS